MSSPLDETPVYPVSVMRIVLTVTPFIDGEDLVSLAMSEIARIDWNQIYSNLTNTSASGGVSATNLVAGTIGIVGASAELLHQSFGQVLSGILNEPASHVYHQVMAGEGNMSMSSNTSNRLNIVAFSIFSSSELTKDSIESQLSPDNFLRVVRERFPEYDANSVDIALWFGSSETSPNASQLVDEFLNEYNLPNLTLDMIGSTQRNVSLLKNVSLYQEEVTVTSNSSLGGQDYLSTTKITRQLVTETRFLSVNVSVPSEFLDRLMRRDTQPQDSSTTRLQLTSPTNLPPPLGTKSLFRMDLLETAVQSTNVTASSVLVRVERSTSLLSYVDAQSLASLLLNDSYSSLMETQLCSDVELRAGDCAFSPHLEQIIPKIKYSQASVGEKVVHGGLQPTDSSVSRQSSPQIAMGTHKKAGYCGSSDFSFSCIDDGDLIFLARAFDDAGNVGVSSPYHFTVDTTPPSLIWLQRPATLSSVTEGGDVSFSFQSNEVNDFGIDTSRFRCGLFRGTLKSISEDLNEYVMNSSIM